MLNFRGISGTGHLVVISFINQQKVITGNGKVSNHNSRIKREKVYSNFSNTFSHFFAKLWFISLFVTQYLGSALFLYSFCLSGNRIQRSAVIIAGQKCGGMEEVVFHLLIILVPRVVFFCQNLK